MKKKIVAAVLSGVLAGGILVSAGPIMADTADANQRTKSAVTEMRRGGGVMRGHSDMGPGFMGKGQEGLVTILDELVADGTITQAKADTIQEKQQEKMIVQREEMAAKHQEMMTEKINQLVEDKIISEDQVAKIKDFLAAHAEERKAQMDELKSMTDEERKAFMEENKDKEKGKGLNILNEMVDEEIINQEQAQKLSVEMPMTGHFGHRNWDSMSQEQE